MRIGLLVPVLVITAGVEVRGQVTVPPPFDQTDAPGQLWVPGATGDLRLLTMIGPPWSDALANKSLVSLTLRRTVRAEAFAQATAQLTVRLSTSPRSVDTASTSFADDHGPDLVTVFAGPVVFPASPIPTGASVPWDAANSVTIAFAAPFAFAGGTLCVDVEGIAVGTPAAAWSADAVQEPTMGHSQSVGAGCGPYAQADGRWSFVNETTLLSGARARFTALGTPGAAALFVLGASAQQNALNLTPLQMPGCWMHLSSPFHTALVLFAPTPHPIARLGAHAEFELALPGTTAVLGMQMACQWLDTGAWTTSNATEWTVAQQPAQNPTCTITGMFANGTAPTAGSISRSKAHVMRFAWQ